MTIQIVENLIPVCWQQGIMDLMTDIPWIRQPGTSYKVNDHSFIQGMDKFEDELTVDSPQFVHFLIDPKQTSPVYSYIRPILYMLEDKLDKKITKICRIKINHQYPIIGFGEHNYNIAHVDDSNGKLLSAVYYINDSDGDTVIFNEKYSSSADIKKLTVLERIRPEAGKVVIFPSTQLHASSNPINTNARYVINFMFEVE
jgi:hypothetical protein